LFGASLVASRIANLVACNTQHGIALVCFFELRFNRWLDGRGTWHLVHDSLERQIDGCASIDIYFPVTEVSLRWRRIATRIPASWTNAVYFDERAVNAVCSGHVVAAIDKPRRYPSSKRRDSSASMRRTSRLLPLTRAIFMVS
jgi:hypothetical protein